MSAQDNRLPRLGSSYTEPWQNGLDTPTSPSPNEVENPPSREAATVPDNEPKKRKAQELYEVRKRHRQSHDSQPEEPASVVAAGPTPSPATTPEPLLRNPSLPPVRAKSPTPGLKSITVLRTCFHIGHLFIEATRCRRANQDALFELYARVVHSSREPGPARVQTFQFQDLFYDNMRPYPTGRLTGWKVGGVIDRLSAVFLEQPEIHRLGEWDLLRKCRCLCRLRWDTTSAIGWVVDVKRIAEVDWDEVEETALAAAGRAVTHNHRR
ncbi:hypothetical protein MFIFM68171_05930 [Madurella fahalii]|uniref:Uncharacterized protein n=1 Tax=Madurella fahalii TaxID=1157608 RepID=A0ABQ0GDU6_9PEZI